jgi:hypothetical protein
MHRSPLAVVHEACARPVRLVRVVQLDFHGTAAAVPGANDEATTMPAHRAGHEDYVTAARQMSKNRADTPDCNLSVLDTLMGGQTRAPAYQAELHAVTWFHAVTTSHNV